MSTRLLNHKIFFCKMQWISVKRSKHNDHQNVALEEKQQIEGDLLLSSLPSTP